MCIYKCILLLPLIFPLSIEILLYFNENRILYYQKSLDLFENVDAKIQINDLSKSSNYLRLTKRKKMSKIKIWMMPFRWNIAFFLLLFIENGLSIEWNAVNRNTIFLPN